MLGRPSGFLIVFLFLCLFVLISSSQFSLSKGKVKGMILKPSQRNSLQMKCPSWRSFSGSVHFMCLSILSVQLEETEEKWIKWILFNRCFSVVYISPNQVPWPQSPQSWELCSRWTPFTRSPKASYPVFPSSLWFQQMLSINVSKSLRCFNYWLKKQAIFTVWNSSQLLSICHLQECGHQDK